MDGKHSRVTFKVRCEVEPGQVVGLSGDASALGYFRHNSVVNLVTTPEQYPIWTTESPIVVPSNHSLQYKYCIIDGGQFSAFEKIDKCRKLVPESFDVVVDDRAIFPRASADECDQDDE